HANLDTEVVLGRRTVASQQVIRSRHQAKVLGQPIFQTATQCRSESVVAAAGSQSAGWSCAAKAQRLAIETEQSVNKRIHTALAEREAGSKYKGVVFIGCRGADAAYCVRETLRIGEAGNVAFDTLPSIRDGVCSSVPVVTIDTAGTVMLQTAM